MQTEVLLPLIGYLVLVFLLSFYAYRRRREGEFLNEYFLGPSQRPMSVPVHLLAAPAQPINMV